MLMNTENNQFNGPSGSSGTSANNGSSNQLPPTLEIAIGSNSAGQIMKTYYFSPKDNKNDIRAIYDSDNNPVKFKGTDIIDALNDTSISGKIKNSEYYVYYTAVGEYMYSSAMPVYDNITPSANDYINVGGNIPPFSKAI
jgi:hypothetical protein